MFGWEFPPFYSGGLGIASSELAKALSKKGLKLTFVLPKKLNVYSPYFDIIFADIKSEFIPTGYPPYITIKQVDYGDGLIEQVIQYGRRVKKIISTLNFDIIHAHDWLSALAGIEAKKISKKPLVLQIHSTEFDRTGNGYVNPAIYHIEKQGMEFADCVIAVSNFTKRKIEKYYGIDPSKIEVVYNAPQDKSYRELEVNLRKLKQLGNRIVLFVGRLALQKGPDYFIRAAKKVLNYRKNVLFVIAGSGEMERQVIRQVASLGISDKVIFAGFVKGENLDRLYQVADLVIMPSVSEPFGLVCLEALANKTPTIISKQSGIREVIKSAIQVDFWDVEEMANKIISVLENPSLARHLTEAGIKEMLNLSWDKSAEQCISIYDSLIDF